MTGRHFIARASKGVSHSRAFMLLTPSHFSMSRLIGIVTRLLAADCRGTYGEMVDGSFVIYVLFPVGTDYGPSFVLDVAGERSCFITAMKTLDVGATRAVLRRDPLCVGLYDFGEVFDRAEN